MPDINKIIAFENGEMDHNDLVDFFQGMIDTGIVWQLQGVYGRTAAYLIECGDCDAQRDVSRWH